MSASDPGLTIALLPVALVLRVKATRTTRLVTIRCPICYRKHQHGWPYSLDTIGSRVAHCVGRNVPTGAPGGYFIPTPTERMLDGVPSRCRAPQ